MNKTNQALKNVTFEKKLISKMTYNTTPNFVSVIIRLNSNFQVTDNLIFFKKIRRCLTSLIFHRHS